MGKTNVFESSALSAAAEILGQLTGWTAHTQQSHQASPEVAADALWEIRDGDRRHAFAVEFKSQVSAPSLPKIIEQSKALQKKHRPPLLLVVPYLPPSLANTMREAGLSYLDLKGNVFLNLPNIKLWFIGAAKNLPGAQSMMQRPKIESLTRSGVKLIYCLLGDPGRINWPYHRLAELAGLSSATVKTTMDWIRRKDFMRVLGSSRKSRRALVNRSQLLELWAKGYDDRLRPKIKIGDFHSLADIAESKEIVSISLLHRHSLWSSETAAEKILTSFRAGGALTLYARSATYLNRVIAEDKLVRDPKGNIELLVPFWPPEDNAGPDIAPYLIVYADLLRSPNSRCWEAAKEIREKHIEQWLGHD